MGARGSIVSEGYLEMPHGFYQVMLGDPAERLVRQRIMVRLCRVHDGVYHCRTLGQVFEAEDRVLLLADEALLDVCRGLDDSESCNMIRT